MERLVNCGIITDIEMIEDISGGNQYFEIVFSAKDKIKYKVILEHVWDLRCSIENASTERFCRFRETMQEGLVSSNVYGVENSEYIKYFENQISGTRPTNELKHYILHDNVDSIIDVLTVEKPILAKHYTAEQIIVKLRQIEEMCSQGKTTAEAICHEGITERIYHRWLNEYKGMDIADCKKLKTLENKIELLQRRIAELSLSHIMPNNSS